MRRWCVIGVLAVLAAFAGAGPAQADLPVIYNFFSGIPGELANPGGSLPGSNNWSCRPSAEHPNPVVLVHGSGGGAQTNWGTYVPLLANEGYCVYALTYGALGTTWPLSALGGLGPTEQSAAELAAFIERILAATGAAQVDIVGHSEGAVMPSYYVERLGGVAEVDKYISLAPDWNGGTDFQMSEIRAYANQLGAATLFDDLCAPCMDLVHNEAVLADLLRDGAYAPGVTYTNIMTRYDEIVSPYTVGNVPGARTTNIVVQDGCPLDYSEHLGLAGSPRAAAFVLNALDPTHPRPVPCAFIPPFTG